VETIRFALYTQVSWTDQLGVAAALALFLAAALVGYDPGRGTMRFKQGGA
jgi:ABC-2 type transport system permease protein